MAPKAVNSSASLFNFILADDFFTTLRCLATAVSSGSTILAFTAVVLQYSEILTDLTYTIAQLDIFIRRIVGG
jgi:hypothetical protein